MGAEQSVPLVEHAVLMKGRRGFRHGGFQSCLTIGSCPEACPVASTALLEDGERKVDATMAATFENQSMAEGMPRAIRR